MYRRSIARRRGFLFALALGVVAAVPSTALAASDLSLTKTDSANSVQEGSELTYTLTIENAGPDAANGVQVVDELPNQVDFIAATPSQGTCDRQAKTVTCELGTLANGATATVEIRVTAKKAGQLTNTATVTTTDDDANPANNTDTETTTVTEPGGGGGGGGAPQCAGTTATIVGTSGGEVLVGGPGRDVIKARGGHDRIRGLGGNDIVCAGGGNDRLRGNAGDDRLKGGRGRDRLRGGGGDDVLAGGPGRDKCRGGSGQDTERSC